MADPWSRGGQPGRRLEGKRALVTGAGTTPDGDLLGIGEAIAVLFAVQGARVGIADVGADRAAATMRLVEEAGGEGVVVVGDLSSHEDNRRCVEEVTEAFGGLDTVVNSAALGAEGGGSPVSLDLDGWGKAMAVNLDAAMFTARHAIPHLIDAGGGSVVNISSIAAVRAFGSGAYAASKAALCGLTRDWAYLHGRDNIRVNCLLPGHVYTPMGTLAGEQVREMRRTSNYLTVEGDAWDIAWPAVFLASDEARWITGQELVIDAGTTSSTALAIQFLQARRPA